MGNNGSLNGIVFYRGLRNLPVRIAEQGILVNKAYTSCSYDIEAALHFTKDKCCIMKFTIPNEVKYCDLLESRVGHTEEREVLIQRNTQFINFEPSTELYKGYTVYSCILKLYAMPVVTLEDKRKQEAL
jgi:hypothetical protein